MEIKDITISVKPNSVTSPVAQCVQLASQFESSIYFEAENKKVNAKSIMGMMALGIKEGLEVTVTADGSDEAEAIESIAEYLVV